MNKKDNIMIVCSAIFLFTAIALLVFAGSGKIKRVFAHWDDHSHGTDTGEFTEEWVATEVSGSARGLAVNSTFPTMSMIRLNETSTHSNASLNGQPVTLTSWYVTGWVDELRDWAVNNGYPATTISSPNEVDGSRSIDWGNIEGPQLGHLISNHPWSVTKWRVYGHINP